jgi:hypothetical protein
MKSKTIILIAFSLLLQSCYSYRVIDKDSNLLIGKKYKIKQSDKYEKVRLLSSTDSTITVNNNKNIENTISLNDIKVIKKREFSEIKTGAIVAPTAIVGILAILLKNYSPNYYKDSGKPLIGP